ncbi:MAG: ADP-ribosylglycohydrolase family protein [Kiritimatiellae bacterium]|nr:ADP-ribosylglycohydrolase family protein [Kiritimatiellia bacterium]
MNISRVKQNLALGERIRGALIGAAIGSELGWARRLRPQAFKVQTAAELWQIPLHPAPPFKQHPKSVNCLNPTPLISLGVRAYLNKQGRVTPEDFGQELMNDRAIAAPVFEWDTLHTTQELLREGIQPRIAGLGTYPNGLLTLAMPAVGIYHFADPEYAYLDGVELASVGQPRLGADWAAIAAAAIAAAFDPANDAEAIVESTLKLAHANAKEAFYQMNPCVQSGRRLFADKQHADYTEWQRTLGRDTAPGLAGLGRNAVRLVLALLEAFDGDARKFMALLLWPENGSHAVAPAIAGAILGARHGLSVFPAEWLKWATPIAKPWFPLEAVVKRRLKVEHQIAAVRKRAHHARRNGMSLLEDKIYGCLLASSIGNAMGSMTEGMLYQQVDEKYPDGVRTVLDPRRLEGEDDNQMAMLLVETYVEREGRPVTARHFGRTWYERLNRDHFFPACMGNTYNLIRDGWDPRIAGHWNQVTGSTVMCMEPVGIYHFADPEYAAIDATAISYMYQRGLDVTAAALLAATVAEALRPDATVEGICDTALRLAPTTPFRTFDRRPFKSPRHYLETCLAVAGRHDDVLEARAELYRRCLLYHFIDPLELWGLALAMFKISKGHVRAAAVGGTNIGRDADTIAGRAAMLAGALRGAGDVPAEWLRLFKPQGLARIRRNAQRLAKLVTHAQLAGGGGRHV